MKDYVQELFQRRSSAINTVDSSQRFIPLYRILGNICDTFSRYKTIHIAGSKGKGSTAHYMNTLLSHLGYKTLLFTSPHLLDVRERFMLNNQIVSHTDWHQALNWLQQREKEEDLALSFFDAMTAIVFFIASNHPIDYLILETGMGGRLDATNICKSTVTLITSIELEHTHILGDTIAAIAREKAGIIKPNVPIFVAQQKDIVMQTIQDHAKILQAPIFSFDNMFSIVENKLIENSSYSFIYKKSEYCATMPTPIKALANNALLALSVIDYLFPHQNIISTFLATIPTATIAGRYQVIYKNIILDGSHTPESFAACSQAFTAQFFHQKRILIFGCAKDKDFHAMSIHFKAYDEIYLVSPKQVEECMSDYAEKAIHSNCSYTPSLTKLLNTLHLNNQEALLIAGSFYLIAEALEFYAKDYHQRLPSSAEE